MDLNIWIHFTVSAVLVSLLYHCFRQSGVMARGTRLRHAVIMTLMLGLFKEVAVDPHGEVLDLLFNFLGCVLAVWSIRASQRRRRR
jgi:hypothetical protein